MKKRKKKGAILIRMGLAMIAAAVLFAGYNFYDAVRAERSSGAALELLEAAIIPEASPAPVWMADDAGAFAEDPVAVDMPVEVEIPDYILNPDMDMPVSKQDGQDYIGILEIPALDLKLPVISEWNYTRLRIAPCRYYGSAYKNNMVISAHNYARHFGTLKKLDGGERVILTDADGNCFDYRVALRETIGPKDIAGMTDSGWDLTLFTCTPGGAYRVAVRCEAI